MTQVHRYDRVAFKARFDENGYLEDSPVLTRTGVFVYQDGKGGIRRELRRAEDVFHADSLASYRNKPITKGHPGVVNATNVRQFQIGTLTSPGRQDGGSDVVGDVVIHDPRVITQDGWKELSVGYSVDLLEEPGEYNGERYDAIQTNIRVNHLAVVPKGRAGNARLTLDAADAVTKTDDDEEDPMPDMVKVRLDSGLEYEAAPEVEQALKKARQDVSDATTKAETEAARADAAEADKKKLEADIEQVRKDAADQARARIQLEETAKTHKVDFKADSADRELREGVIKAIRGDSIDLKDKSDAYVDAAYDFALTEHKSRLDAGAEQRKAATGNRNDANDSNGVSAMSAREKMKARMRGEKIEEAK